MPCRRIYASKNCVTFRVTQRKLKHTQFSMVDISSSFDMVVYMHYRKACVNFLFDEVISHRRVLLQNTNPPQPSKGWKMSANAIYVGRPTVWGNPYVVGSELMNGETLTAEKAVELYEQHLVDNFSERDIRHCLHDKDLACWCALDEPCHADVLLRIANSRPK